ncbi:MAG: hypothetical protein WBG86_02160 [Polyangiales bacterium]
MPKPQGVGRCIALLVLSSLVAPVGCSQLGINAGDFGLEPPRVSIASVRLVEVPSTSALGSYYCAQQFGPTVCSVFGPVPSADDVGFAFDVTLDLQNPNPLPLPVVQSLFAFQAFPEEKGVENLGTVCLSFCEDPSDCEQSPSACQSDDPEIRDASDFGGAARDFLFSVAQGEGRFGDLRVQTIPANDTSTMVVRLGIDPRRMLDLIKTAASGELDNVRSGGFPDLAVPYRIEGTAWVAVEALGRLATDFGPTDGSWAL